MSEDRRRSMSQLKKKGNLPFLHLLVLFGSSMDTVITLPTEVHIIKAVVFPVVMYGCESWTIKKAKPQTIDAF